MQKMERPRHCGRSIFLEDADGGKLALDGSGDDTANNVLLQG